MQAKSVYLVLENGMTFTGKSFGFESEAIGEIVFTTSMTGYMSTLTDTGYAGKFVVQTFPLIGNYGVVTPECESKGTSLRAYIVRELCQEPSNFRCEGGLDVFLNENKIIGVSGIDTRKLTRIIRDNGSMKAKILYEEPTDIEAIKAELKAYTEDSPVKAVTCKEVTTADSATHEHKVVVWDFGASDSIAAELTKRGCDVITVPAYTKAEDVLAYNPDGIVLSNGPGCACENPDIVAEIGKAAKGGVPVLGICLGHLMLAVSQGAKCVKLPHGHRGGMPVIRTSDKKVFITSHNQGFTLEESTLPKNITPIYKNGNDATVEGVAYTGIKGFSVQFRPSPVGGPNATDFVYDEFISLMK